MSLFIVLAVVGALVAAAIVAIPLWREPGTEEGRRHRLAAALCAGAIPVAVAAIYLAVSNYDWASPPAPVADAADIETAVAMLEKRLRDETPADAEGWTMLGGSYVALGRPADAIDAYQKAIDLTGGADSTALLGRAEAEILVDRNAMFGRAGDDFEAVLGVEPRNPKALWYGGLVALARDDPASARTRWGALLELGPPEAIRQILEIQLAALDSGSDDGLDAVAGDSAGAAQAGIAFEVHVSVSEEVRSRISGSAPLFVFVRDAAAPGPPLAVIRRQASELPVTVSISDADVMIPGRSLASIERAELVARVANGGDPVAKPGDAFGEAEWSSGSGASGPIDIVIDRVVTP